MLGKAGMQAQLTADTPEVWPPRQQSGVMGHWVHAGCWGAYVAQQSHLGDINLHFTWISLQMEEAQFIARFALVLLFCCCFFNVMAELSESAWKDVVETSMLLILISLITGTTYMLYTLPGRNGFGLVRCMVYQGFRNRQISQGLTIPIFGRLT